MTESVDPGTFHDDVIQGVDKYKTITLTSESDRELEGVEMHIVSKAELTRAVEAMPDDVFDGIDSEEEDLTPEEAEELAEEQSGAHVTEDMYDAFEKLCKASLQHEGLSETQMGLIIDEFAFDIVFELGSEILNHSIENSGNVKDFRVQS